MQNHIIVYRDSESFYPTSDFFYSPEEVYPEYPFSNALSSKPNKAYEMVRNTFHMMGLDEEHFGTKDWNPLRCYVKPGDTIVVKPNLVMDSNPNEEKGDTISLITHPSLVRAVVDYVLIATKGIGQVIIGDAPLQRCDFEKLLTNTGYGRLIEFYKAHSGLVEVRDFRSVKTIRVNGAIVGEQPLTDIGVTVDLKDKSSFNSITADRYKRLRVTDYDPRIMLDHHNTTINEYSIARDILAADLVINMPKPKTHKKAGVTAAMKNLVGINTNKEWLPHHTLGSIEEGGDEYENRSVLRVWAGRLIDKRNKYDAHKQYGRARMCYYLSHGMDKLYRTISPDAPSEGSWHGNDTIWRTILDLNRILIFANKDGLMCNKPQRQVLIVADMIVSGEKEGPMTPTPKVCNTLIAGNNPLALDECVTSLMVFNCDDIPYLHHARESEERLNALTTGEYIVKSNEPAFDGLNVREIQYKDSFMFVPASGWSRKLRNEANDKK
jgi:uncharacterized protein (DUF362 family)